MRIRTKSMSSDETYEYLKARYERISALTRTWTDTWSQKSREPLAMLGIYTDDNYTPQVYSHIADLHELMSQKMMVVDGDFQTNKLANLNAGGRPLMMGQGNAQQRNPPRGPAYSYKDPQEDVSALDKIMRGLLDELRSREVEGTGAERSALTSGERSFINVTQALSPITTTIITKIASNINPNDLALKGALKLEGDNFKAAEDVPVFGGLLKAVDWGLRKVGFNLKDPENAPEPESWWRALLDIIELALTPLWLILGVDLTEEQKDMVVIGAIIGILVLFIVLPALAQIKTIIW